MLVLLLYDGGNHGGAVLELVRFVCCQLEPNCV